jgi:protease inhibitor Inh
MNSLKLLLTASALTLTTLSAAYAQAGAPTAGSYKLAIGANASCALTLAADGTASYASDCAQGAHVARWQAKFNGVVLETSSGEAVAILTQKDGAYAGTRVEDGRKLVLSNDGAAVASSH